MAKPPHVLLVEDDDVDVELAELATRGFSWGGDALEVANTGSMALEALSNMTFDLVLLDFNLPGKSGIELLSEIRALDTSNIVPIIVFSGSAAPHDVRAAYESGANGYVQKKNSLAESRDAFNAIDDFWFRSACLPEFA